MPKMLEINRIISNRMEQLRLFPVAPMADKPVLVLNMPGRNLCEKRGEIVLSPEGKKEMACKGCVHTGLETKTGLYRPQIHDVLRYFSARGVAVLAINGRGDPFHPELKIETLDKISLANRLGIKSYIFTSGSNLSSDVCMRLAGYGANVMVSLHGNKFIDADFFARKKYYSSKHPFQNQYEIAKNIRELFGTYLDPAWRGEPPLSGTTRLGMNYVVTDQDIADKGAKVKLLRQAANENGIFFICNVEFGLNPTTGRYSALKSLARESSDFNMEHSTAVNGQCQMGAGYSVTVDYDGTFFRCPYLTGKGDGNFFNMNEDERSALIRRYLDDTGFACTQRKTPVR